MPATRSHRPVRRRAVQPDPGCPACRADPLRRLMVFAVYVGVATAVEATKLGTTHYSTQPAKADQIVSALHRASEGPRCVIYRATALCSATLMRSEQSQAVLEGHDGNISSAAHALKAHRRSLPRNPQKRTAESRWPACCVACTRLLVYPSASVQPPARRCRSDPPQRDVTPSERCPSG